MFTWIMVSVGLSSICSARMGGDIGATTLPYVRMVGWLETSQGSNGVDLVEDDLPAQQVLARIEDVVIDFLKSLVVDRSLPELVLVRQLLRHGVHVALSVKALRVCWSSAYLQAHVSVRRGTCADAAAAARRSSLPLQTGNPTVRSLSRRQANEAYAFVRAFKVRWAFCTSLLLLLLWWTLNRQGFRAAGARVGARACSVSEAGDAEGSLLPLDMPAPI